MNVSLYLLTSLMGLLNGYGETAFTDLLTLVLQNPKVYRPITDFQGRVKRLLLDLSHV